jgi:protein TonB
MTGAASFNAKRHPTALIVVVLMHGAALGALALAKMDVIGPTKAPPTIIELIKNPPPPPPPEPLPQPQAKPQHQSRIEVVEPVVRTVPAPPIFDPTPMPPPTRIEFTPPGPAIVPPSPPPPPPPPPVAKKVEPARARANLASYVSDADYPAAAIRGEQQGTTRFRLVVSPDGRVSECTVTGSSGSSALDSATCRLMKQRARFTPARNSDGNPTSDTVANAIKWVLPDG